MLPLCASTARHEGATRFFQAFYRWTRLTTRDHAYTPPPPRSVAAHVQTRTRAYSSVVETASPEDQSNATSPVHDAHPLIDFQRTIFVEPDYYATLTASDSELLKKVSRFSRVNFRLEKTQKTQKSQRRRIFLRGTRPAVDIAVDYIDSLKDHLSGNLPDLPDITNPNIAFYGVGTPDKGVQKRARDLYHHAFDADNPVRTRTRTLTFTRSELRHVDSLDEKALSIIRLSAGVQKLDIVHDSATTNRPRPHICVSGTKDSVEKALTLIRALLQKEIDTHTTSNFRSSMRAVPNPVAVITTGNVKLEGDWEDIAELRGMTVSSFTPVTLSPAPIISFNIRTPSRTLEALDKFGDVTVHILASNSDGATIANAFTKPYDDPAEAFRNLHDMERDISIYPTPSRPPQIVGPGVLTRLRCKILLDKRLKIGDHVVVFAKVLSVIKGSGENRKGDDEDHFTDTNVDSSTATALAYAHGRYCGVSETFEPETFIPASTEESSSLPNNSVSASTSNASEVPTDTETASPAPSTNMRDATSWNAQKRQYSTVQRTSTLPNSNPPNQPRSFSSSPSNQANKNIPSDSNPDLSTTKVHDYLAQSPHPGKSQKMRLRQKQKAFLDSTLEKLEEAKQSGRIDDDEMFVARQFQILTLRQDVVEGKLVESQWVDFLEWTAEAFPS